jgi:hypothetical protein
LCLLALPHASFADFDAQLGVGPFAPWDGEVGYLVGVAVLSRDEGQSRVGVGLEARVFETELVGADDIDVETYRLKGIWHYLMLEDAGWTPYVGVEVSALVSSIDTDEIERQTGKNVNDEVGFGLGLAGVFGIEYEVSERITLFGEAQLGGDILLTDDGDHEADASNLGGAGGNFGVRVRF